MKKIICPTLILNREKAIKNIDFMISKAQKHELALRPHFKTHQSIEVGNWFKEKGVTSITVSSVEMAKYFANHGWEDITIAFPVNILEIDDINFLANKIQLNLLVENLESMDYLTKNLTSPVSVFIKIDTGYHRTGVPFSEQDLIKQIIEKCIKSENQNFKGFLTHAGHTYKAQNTNEIESIHQDTISKMKKLKDAFSVFSPLISVGDTPSCSISDNFDGVDEIRPGNFVFYDVMQLELGSCRSDQIACYAACPIVAIHKNRNEIVVYGGGIHLSKESIILNDKKIFGIAGVLHDNLESEPNKNLLVTSLSQEHGTIKVLDDSINNFLIGDLVAIFPIHSCMTANLMQRYIDLEGNSIDHLSGVK